MTPHRLVCALFDLDNTLYPKSAGIMDVVGKRINEYMALRMGMDDATIKALRSRYWEQYGTTMRGLLLEYGINAEDYLEYVHGFSAQELLAPNLELDGVLAQLPWRKVIFTSSTREHTQQVLAALAPLRSAAGTCAIARHFERIFDIRDTGYICKPDPAAYHTVLRALDLQAEQCLLVDDSLANLQSAANLGMVTVWVGSHPKEGVRSTYPEEGVRSTYDRAAGVTWAIDQVERIVDVAQAESNPEEGVRAQ